MVQFSLNVKKSSERIDEVSYPLYFLKYQISHYINICISFSKKVIYKKSIFYCLFVNYPYTVYIYIYIYILVLSKLTR